MPTVAVTGSSGYLGRKTLERLSKEPDVSRVVGIDVAEPGFSTRNLEFYRLDVRSPDLEHAIRGCDVLVHMAFLQSGREADEMRDVNVGGTRRVFEAAARADIRKIVYVSDALAYGAHPDNDFPLTEDSPLRPNADLPYADHKRETEDIAKAFALAHGDLVVTVLRPCQVLGPDVSGPSARLVQTPVGLMVKGYDPPVQVLHEDDLAEALMLTLAQDLRGVFNVAPDDSLELSAVLSALGRRKLLLGRDRAVRRSEQLWRMRLSELHPADVYSLMYPCVVSSAKLESHGFSPARTTAQALREAADARRQWVSVGNVSFRPRRVALVAGSLGLAVLGSAARSAFGRAKREKA